jgi:UDP-GlcNAc:undecaprenyl-phosphate GlcNAc-1-phosphate transferase
VGFVDDLRQISPAAKLTAQVVATGLLLYAGYAFGQGWPVWLSLPLTFLWVVGITNAVNLLDNMDGLAAGVAGVAALVLATFAGLVGSVPAVVAASAVAGAAAGFLVFNFKPARIFMGDCGSLFLGYTIAALALVIQGHVADDASRLAPYLVPVAVLAVPIFDTTLVTLMRKMAGRPVSQGGRDHCSHRLVFLGLSERHAVLMLYGLSLLSGALALVSLAVDEMLFYALTAFVGVAMVVLGVHLARANVYGEAASGDTSGDGAPARSTAPTAAGAEQPPIPRVFRVLHALLGRRWKTVVGLGADVLLVAAAYTLAHFLRFEHDLAPAREALLLETLPLVVAAKIVVFYAMGLYRGLWRHAGTPEGVRLVTATTLAMGVTFVGLGVLYGPERLSTAVFLIDWMVTTLAVGGTRFGFRALRQYMAASRRRGTRVLLYGAGDRGLLTLRLLRHHPAGDRVPVGFVDDDPAKRGQSVQGLRVLGTGDRLAALCRLYRIEEVLITSVTMPAERRDQAATACAAADVPCRIFVPTFEQVSDERDADAPLHTDGPPTIGPPHHPSLA